MAIVLPNVEISLRQNTAAAALVDGTTHSLSLSLVVSLISHHHIIIVVVDRHHHELHVVDAFIPSSERREEE